MADTKHSHSGHRDRVRERFAAEGLDAFAAHNILELVLFYSVPRRDTNELAHRLLDHFGSLAAVFDASIERLMQVKGITYNSAVLIKLVTATARRYEISKFDTGVVLNDTSAASDYAMRFFIGASEETAYLISMDGKNKVLCCDKIAEGSVNATEISIRKIIDSAVKHKAVKVILTHSHPAGKATPSHDDIATTARIRDVLCEMDIRLEDHIIIGGNGKRESMRELGLIHD